MKIQLTPQLLGMLMDQGYTYALVKTDLGSDISDLETIYLTPIKEKPELISLPNEYQTFYKLTQEPLQLLSSNDSISLIVELKSEINYLKNDFEYSDDYYFNYNDDFFERVLDSIKEYAVFTTNRNGEVNSWNRGAEELFGYKRNEILGLNVSVLFRSDANDTYREVLKIALKEGVAASEMVHHHKEGSMFLGSSQVFPLFDNKKRHKGFTQIVRKLEEKKLPANFNIENVLIR